VRGISSCCEAAGAKEGDEETTSREIDDGRCSRKKMAAHRAAQSGDGGRTWDRGRHRERRVRRRRKDRGRSTSPTTRRIPEGAGNGAAAEELLAVARARGREELRGVHRCGKSARKGSGMTLIGGRERRGRRPRQWPLTAGDADGLDGNQGGALESEKQLGRLMRGDVRVLQCAFKAGLKAG
jgi:hypothetical protein